MGLTEMFGKCNVLGSVIMNLITIKHAVINTGHLQSLLSLQPFFSRIEKHIVSADRTSIPTRMSSGIWLDVNIVDRVEGNNNCPSIT